MVLEVRDLEVCKLPESWYWSWCLLEAILDQVVRLLAVVLHVQRITINYEAELKYNYLVIHCLEFQVILMQLVVIKLLHVFLLFNKYSFQGLKNQN